MHELINDDVVPKQRLLHNDARLIHPIERHTTQSLVLAHKMTFVHYQNAGFNQANNGSGFVTEETNY